MGEFLTAPNVENTSALIDIYWGLSPSDRAEYDSAKEEYKGDDSEGFMKNYFKEHNFI